MQEGTQFCLPEPNMNRDAKVRTGSTCRGPRAWHAQKERHGTWEVRNIPAALTARAKRVRQLNDKKRGPKVNRKSDRLIVRTPAAQAKGKMKGPTHTRSPQRKPAA